MYAIQLRNALGNCVLLAISYLKELQLKRRLPLQKDMLARRRKIGKKRNREKEDDDE